MSGLKVEPLSITAPGCFRVATTYGERMSLNAGEFPKATARQLGEALIHFADHGTFCPEPPKRIEWIEAIPGVLLHSGEWSIRLDGSYYHVFVGVRRKSYHSNIAEAKAYAEQKMREEDRRGV